jgi:predicted phosphodiesterase
VKFHLVSDLHLDHWEDDCFVYDLCPEGDETLIIAGDLCESYYLKGAAAFALGILCEKYRNVVYVLGNHEYYGSFYKEVQRKFAELDERFENLFCLDDQLLVLEGVTIAGTTLWFRNTPMNPLYEREMQDFRLIQNFRSWVYGENARSLEFLKSVAHDKSRGNFETDLVITHHLPSFKSVNARYERNPVNLYFLCDVSEIMLDMGPKVWVHGHTHVPCDYQLGDTRVVCNPRGYPGQNPGEYHPVIIEI